MGWPPLPCLWLGHPGPAESAHPVTLGPLLTSGPESPALEKPPEKDEEGAQRGEHPPGEPLDGHLADLLQQLSLVNAAKPSDRAPIRQGEQACGQGRGGGQVGWPSGGRGSPQ